MLRFVALVATEGLGLPEATAAAADRHFAQWTALLRRSRVMVWATRTGEALAWEPSGDGCVLGRTFREPSSTAGAGAVLDLEALLRDRWGAYVAFQVEPATGAVHVLRDPTGRIECWRLRLAGFDVLFSHLEDVRWLAGHALEINWDFLVYHLSNDWCRGAETGFTAITEVLPGEQLTYRGGGVSTTRAWRPDRIAADRFRDRGAAKAALRRAAEASVTCWAGQYRSIGLDLSGGLDSAIMLGLLARVADHPRLVAVNWVVPHSEGDERAFARDAAALHGVELVEVTVVPARPSDTFADRLLRPSTRMMPLGYDELSREVGDRYAIDGFFTGTGGDHLFFDHPGPIGAADGLLRMGPGPRFLGLAYRLALISDETLWHVVAEAAKASTHRPSARERLERPNPFLSAEGRAAADYERFAHPWLADGGGTPPAKLRQILNISELQTHYWRYGRADVADEVHAFFSQPLVEACLRTPSDWFVEGDMQRGLQRQLFADLLPDSIRRRRTKGVNISHWATVLSLHLPSFREALLDGELVGRGILLRDPLERALTPGAIATDRNVTPLVRCITTELWVQASKGRVGQAPSAAREVV